jgi:hypothetical protein
VGNAVILQDDWSGGIYRGRKAPPNMAYDIINGLINDEGHVFRRPGTAYYTTADAPVTPIAAYAGYMTGPRARRVLAWNDSTTLAVKDDLTVMTVADVVAPHNRRPAFIAGGFLVFPGVDPGGGVKITIYGGALTNTPYSAGTAQIDFDSTRVRGTGTAWLANAQPGMILTSSVTAGTGAVGRVVSDTELTLTTPWKGSTTNVGYALTNQQTLVYGSWLPLLGPTRVGAAGTVASLIIATGNRAYFASQTFQLSELLYHELPEGVEILAVEGIGDSALLFTTGGVWRIDNLSLDVIDDQGNIQQQVTRVAPKIALWGECGISGWAGGVIVPALDDVMLVSADGETVTLSGNPENAKIRNLYRAYTGLDGYEPGFATVWRGHYFLPILASGLWVDTLVCRLDRGAAWTRWWGHAAGTAFAALPATATSAAKLLGVKGARVTDLTGCMETTGNPLDADGGTPQFLVDSTDDDLGPGIRPNTAEKIRYVYETNGAGPPVFSVSSAIGPETAPFAAAILKRGGGASNGTNYSAWRVGRKAERIRFRFNCTSSTVTSLILRRREVTIRRAGQT